MKAIICEVFSREMQYAASMSPHAIEVEPVTMGLHDLGAGMRSNLQQKIDASDDGRYDAILLGYALCGRGTEGLHAGGTTLVMPRAHDCIGVLMGSRERHRKYFESHPGVYYRSPGWIEFQKPGQRLEPAMLSAKNTLGERRTREELIAEYGEDNGSFLYKQFTAYRHAYTGLTYISTGIGGEDACRDQARVEAAREHWRFEEVIGSTRLLEKMANGDWDPEEILVVPAGHRVRATMRDDIVAAA